LWWKGNNKEPVTNHFDDKPKQFCVEIEQSKVKNLNNVPEVPRSLGFSGDFSSLLNEIG
jgi:hypothetical protein